MYYNLKGLDNIIAIYYIIIWNIFNDFWFILIGKLGVYDRSIQHSNSCNKW